MENVVKCKCGTEFDLAKAKWCKHVEESGYGTKECPNCGRCICHKLGNRELWRPATIDEQRLGFSSMLKEKYGGIKESSVV